MIAAEAGSGFGRTGAWKRRGVTLNSEFETADSLGRAAATEVFLTADLRLLHRLFRRRIFARLPNHSAFNANLLCCNHLWRNLRLTSIFGFGFNVTLAPRTLFPAASAAYVAFHSTSRERGARKNVFGRKRTSWPATRRRVGRRELTSSKTTRASNRARNAPRQKCVPYPKER